jgi:hypothetical protein
VIAMLSLPLAALSYIAVQRAKASYGQGFARTAAIFLVAAWVFFIGAVSAFVFGFNVSKL